MKLFFFVNCSINKAIETAKNAMKILNKLHCVSAIEKKQSKHFEKLATIDDLDNLKQYDLIISVGGDGTVISASKFAVKCDLPILGINAGHMGFLCGLNYDKLHNLKKLLNLNYFIKQRMLLNITYEKNQWIAVNDAVITKPTFHGFVNLSVFDGSNFIINYRSDSVLFSTPTGSTAYSLSNGGPIADPDLKFIAMSPICAHSLISRTNLFSENSVLNVKIGGESEACLILDGVVVKLLKQNSKIQIQKSEFVLKLIYLEDLHFFKLVKNKFF